MLQVKKVVPMSHHKLCITFDTDETRVFDVTPYIIGSWYGQLADQAYFGQVRPCGDTVEWPNGQDIAPHELYDLSVPLQSSGQ